MYSSTDRNPENGLYSLKETRKQNEPRTSCVLRINGFGLHCNFKVRYLAQKFNEIRVHPYFVNGTACNKWADELHKHITILYFDNNNTKKTKPRAYFIVLSVFINLL